MVTFIGRARDAEQRSRKVVEDPAAGGFADVQHRPPAIADIDAYLAASEQWLASSFQLPVCCWNTSVQRMVRA